MLNIPVIIMRSILCSLCILVSTTLPLLAQSESGADTGKKFARSAWFACTSIPDGLENPVKVLTGDEITKLEVHEFMTSDPVKIPEDGMIRIVREVSDLEDPKKPKYLVLAVAEIPEGVREALIILVPLPEPKGTLVFRALVQDLADFKGGDRLFINMSNTNIGVQIGKTKIAVPAHQSKIYESPKLSKPANMPIIYQFYHPVREEWKLLTASTVVLYPTRRQICIFNNGSRIGNVKRHNILFPVRVEIPEITQ